ncbi:MAG: hypothetical protein R3F29_12540 [Planctomycetota bacterium]
MIRPSPGAGAMPPRHKISFCLHVAASALAVLMATPLTAQQVAPGLTTTAAAIPTSAAAAAESAHGTWVFDGNQLVAQNRAGVSRVTLQLPYWTWATCLVPLEGDSMLLGEGQGGLWRVSPSGAPSRRPFVTIPFHYDAAPLDAHTVLVSARTGGWAATDNDLLAIDLDTGGVQLLAVVDGASGPLTIAPSGDLIYATASNVYPTPPGSVQIVSFARAIVDAALATQTVLTLNDATTLFSGLDAAADLAFDSDGDLFFTDFVNRTVGEIHDLEGAAPTLRAPLVDYATSPLSPGTLQFLAAPSANAGAFEPMQPPGGRLLVFATDYVSTGELHEVRALRPELDGPGGAIATGPFSISLTDGPPNGLALLLLGQGGELGESALPLTGFEQPLWLDAATFSSPSPSLVAIDALGAATLSLHNPGFAAVTAMTAQCACLSTSGVLGSTTPTELSLGQ